MPLRIDNGDFQVNGCVFTVLLIYLSLHDIADIMKHQIEAEIISYLMISIV